MYSCNLQKTCTKIPHLNPGLMPVMNLSLLLVPSVRHSRSKTPPTKDDSEENVSIFLWSLLKQLTPDPVMKTNLPHVNPALLYGECGETLPQKSQVLGTASSVWMAGARHLPVLGGVMYMYVNGHMCTCVEARGQTSTVITRGVPL